MALTSFTLRKPTVSGGSGNRRETDASANPATDNSLRADGFIAVAPPAARESFFSAEVYLRNEIELSWELDSSLSASAISAEFAVTEIIIKASTSGEPITVKDGFSVITINSNNVSSFVNENDTYVYKDQNPLYVQEGNWVYYALFGKYENNTGDAFYERLAVLSVQIPRDWGSTEDLWEKVPTYYKELDEDLLRQLQVESASYPYDKGPLYRYVSLFGWELDKIRTTIYDTMRINDPSVIHSSAIDALGYQVGAEINKDALGTIKLRNLLNNIGYLRRIKGTEGSVQAYVAALSGSYVSTITDGASTIFNIHPHRVNLFSDPNFANSLGSPTITGPITEKVISLSVLENLNFIYFDDTTTYLYAFSDDGKVIRSTNNGLTWTYRVSSTRGIVGFAVNPYGGASKKYIRMNKWGEIHFTNDLSGTWTAGTPLPGYPNPIYTKCTIVAKDESGITRWYIPQGPELYVTEYDGTIPPIPAYTFTSGENIIAISNLPDEKLLVLTDENVLYYYDTTTSTAASVTTPFAPTVLTSSADLFSGRIIIANDNEIAYTDNYTTFTPWVYSASSGGVFDNEPISYLKILDPYIFAIGNNRKFAYSADQGETWIVQPVILDPSTEINDVALSYLNSLESFVYLAGDNKRLGIGKIYPDTVLNTYSVFGDWSNTVAGLNGEYGWGIYALSDISDSSGITVNISNREVSITCTKDTELAVYSRTSFNYDIGSDLVYYGSAVSSASFSINFLEYDLISSIEAGNYDIYNPTSIQFWSLNPSLELLSTGNRRIVKFDDTGIIGLNAEVVPCFVFNVPAGETVTIKEPLFEYNNSSAEFFTGNSVQGGFIEDATGSTLGVYDYYWGETGSGSPDSDFSFYTLDAKRVRQVVENVITEYVMPVNQVKNTDYFINWDVIQ